MRYPRLSAFGATHVAIVQRWLTLLLVLPRVAVSLHCLCLHLAAGGHHLHFTVATTAKTTLHLHCVNNVTSKMAFWTAASYRETQVDTSLDPGMYWEDINSASTDDPTNDFFGQFVDFDGQDTAPTSAVDEFQDLETSMHGMPESILLMDGHAPALESTASSGLSSGDEFDFLSSSSHAGNTTSAASHEIDPKDLALSGNDTGNGSQQGELEFVGRASMSEADLSRLEGISLRSPHKKKASASDPSSPTPPNTDTRKPKKFVEALSSTIKKATTLRRNKKGAAINRPGSPNIDQQQQQPLKLPKQRRGRTRAVTHGNLPVSPPIQQLDQANGHFINGQFDDPFNESPILPLGGANMQYFGQVAPDTPVESPGVKSEAGQGQFQVDPAWQQQNMQWTGAGGEYVTSQEGGWWNPNMMGQASNEYAHHQRSASMHVVGNGQQNGMTYEFAPVQDTSTGGLMIHMPQPRGGQSTVVNDLTAQTYLPPPQEQKVPASERSHRPPKAKSSGARHMSCSPVRRQRNPSASPGPTDQSVPRSRHSSGGSISSIRSSSGRLPGSMPGTPCSVRKRRSRDVSASGGSGISLGGEGGGGIGFVNFTPNDGSVLMTGVAPSGSSKTKARREKEAQERRRRLSEAAIKAVAAAGGDVDKLLEQGFTF